MEITMPSTGANIYGLNTETPQDPQKTEGAAKPALDGVLAKDNVTMTEKTGGIGEGRTVDTTETPAIEDPEIDSSVMGAVLDKLVGYLQLEDDEQQLESLKQRLNTCKEALQAEYKERETKIEMALTLLAVKAKGGGLFASRWLGNMALMAVAIKSALPEDSEAAKKLSDALGYATGDNGFFGRLFACIKLENALESAFKELGMDGGGADCLARDVARGSFKRAALRAAFITAMLGDKIENGGAIKDALDTVKMFKEAVKDSLHQYLDDLMKTPSNAKQGAEELAKIIQMLEQRLEENQEEIVNMLQSIQTGIADVLSLISSVSDTTDEITLNSSQMA